MDNKDLEAVADPSNKPAWEKIGGDWLPAEIICVDGPCKGQVFTFNMDRMKEWYPVKGEGGTMYAYSCLTGLYGGEWTPPKVTIFSPVPEAL